MAIVRHVSGFMRGNTTRTALYYSAKSIFEIRKKKGKKDCEVALAKLRENNCCTRAFWWGMGWEGGDLGCCKGPGCKISP